MQFPLGASIPWMNISANFVFQTFVRVEFLLFGSAGEVEKKQRQLFFLSDFDVSGGLRLWSHQKVFVRRDESEKSTSEHLVCLNFKFSHYGRFGVYLFGVDHTYPYIICCNV